MKGYQVAIAGVGETPFVRVSRHSLAELLVEASRNAIADAGLDPRDIDGFVRSDGAPPIDDLAFALGVRERRFVAANELVAGAASVGGALILAQLAIEAGLARHVLVPYGIKCSDPGGPYAFHERDPLKADIEMPVGYFGQPAYFATIAQRYRKAHGLAEQELAAVSLSARAWAGLTPNAQRKDPLDLDGYRRSPVIATPFRAADCCLMSDGACAYVVTSAERARDLEKPVVYVAGVAVGTNPLPMSMVLSQAADIAAFPGRQSAALAYPMAGLSPKDVDLAQIYDCFSISTLIQAEMLGLCPEGEGGRLFGAGHTRPGGRMPINTSGGHLSGGYIPGANLVVEGVRQLRGERGEGQVAGARVCAVAGLGANAHATTLLTTVN